MRALDIITAEHANMWRVTNALGVLADRLGRAPSSTDLQTITLIATYLDEFSERFHHPKENDLLFAHVRRRSNSSAAIIDRLEHDHRMSPRQVEHIRDLARSTETSDDRTLARLIDEITTFRHRLGEHMRIEEEEIFPLARDVLTPEDWEEVDTAFLAHVDPLGDADAAEDIALLRARITRLLPAPEGLGGQTDVVSVHVPHSRIEKTGTLLEISDLTCCHGRIEALHAVSLRIGAGELVALVGANGAGKTTMLRAVSGVLPTAGGCVRFDGQDVTRMRADARVRAGIAQVPEGRQVFQPMSIEDNLRMGAYTRPRNEIRAGLDEVYDLFPILRERRKLPAGTLSGGQQQMLALGRAMMSKPKLMLLDEPSMGLAPLIVKEIFRIVKMLKEAGMTILLVEQNARAALALADHAYVLETGSITLDGPGPELLRNDDVRRAYLGM